jgi:hypothetical protein
MSKSKLFIEKFKSLTEEKKTYRCHYKDAKGADQSTTVDAESAAEARDSFDSKFPNATHVEIALDK